MTDASPRYALPFILPGQAQKELFHNEALGMIDMALHPVAERADLPEPPAAPTEGRCWIVAAGASGAWSGKQNLLACWTAGGWRFLQPTPGMLVWLAPAGHWLHWNGNGWNAALPVERLTIGGVQVVGPRQPAVPSPSGGTTIDEQARTAVAALTAALKTHGLID